MVRFYPKAGCPGPVELQLADNVILVIIDSQWFLHPYARPTANTCPCNTEAEVFQRVDQILYRNQDKTVVIAAHHPVYSYGEHGGHYTWKQHLFPLTDMNKDLLIPLPVIGSLYPLYRSVFGSRQDLPHPAYKKYRQGIEALLQKYPQTLYVAGHEHGLQYILKDQVAYIVSGAGVKTNVVKKKGYAQFAASATGFVKLAFLSGGQCQIEFVGDKGTLYSTLWMPQSKAK